MPSGKLDQFFTKVLEKVESSEIQNNGKDKDGFYEPTRAMLMQRLALLRDLHSKTGAKVMVQNAWKYVVEHVPPEWLILDDEEKAQLKKVLS